MRWHLLAIGASALVLSPLLLVALAVGLVLQQPTLATVGTGLLLLGPLATVRMSHGTPLDGRVAPAAVAAAVAWVLALLAGRGGTSGNTAGASAWASRARLATAIALAFGVMAALHTAASR
jgi:hypothetical protein